MSVIDEVCGVKGHAIQSYTIRDVVDPMAKVTVHVYEYRCSQCGFTLEKLSTYKISGRGKARQREAKKNGNHANPSGSSKEAGRNISSNQTPEPEPVHGSEPVVLEPGLQHNPDQS